MVKIGRKVCKHGLFCYFFVDVIHLRNKFQDYIYDKCCYSVYKDLSLLTNSNNITADSCRISRQKPSLLLKMDSFF